MSNNREIQDSSYMKVALRRVLMERLASLLPSTDERKEDAVNYVLEQLLKIYHVHNSSSSDYSSSIVPYVASAIPSGEFFETADCAALVENALFTLLVGDSLDDRNRLVKELKSELQGYNFHSTADYISKAANIQSRFTALNKLDINAKIKQHQRQLCDSDPINNKVDEITTDVETQIAVLSKQSTLDMTSKVNYSGKIQHQTIKKPLANGRYQVEITTPLICRWSDGEPEIPHCLTLERKAIYHVERDGSYTLLEDTPVSYTISDDDAHSRIEFHALQSKQQSAAKEFFDTLDITYQEPAQDQALYHLHVGADAFNHINELYHSDDLGTLFTTEGSDTFYKAFAELLARGTAMTNLRNFLGNGNSSSLTRQYMASLFIAESFVEHDYKLADDTINKLKQNIIQYCGADLLNNVEFSSTEQVKLFQQRLLTELNKINYLCNENGAITDEPLSVDYFEKQQKEIRRGDSHIPDSYSSEKNIVNYLEYIRSKQPKESDVNNTQLSNMLIIMLQSNAITGGLAHKASEALRGVFTSLTSEAGVQTNKALNIENIYIDVDGNYKFVLQAELSDMTERKLGHGRYELHISPDGQLSIDDCDMTFSIASTEQKQTLEKKLPQQSITQEGSSVEIEVASEHVPANEQNQNLLLQTELNSLFMQAKRWTDRVLFSEDFSPTLCALLLIEEYLQHKNEQVNINGKRYHASFEVLLQRLNTLSIDTEGLAEDGLQAKSELLVQQFNNVHTLPYTYQVSSRKIENTKLTRDLVQKTIQDTRDRSTLLDNCLPAEKRAGNTTPFWYYFDEICKQPADAGKIIMQLQQQKIHGELVNCATMGQKFIKHVVDDILPVASDSTQQYIPEVTLTTVDALQMQDGNAPCYQITVKGTVFDKHWDSSVSPDGAMVQKQAGDFEFQLKVTQGKLGEITAINVNLDIPNKDTYDKAASQIKKHCHKKALDTEAEYYQKLSIEGSYVRIPNNRFVNHWNWKVKAQKPVLKSIKNSVLQFFDGIGQKLKNLFSRGPRSTEDAIGSLNAKEEIEEVYIEPDHISNSNVTNPKAGSTGFVLHSMPNSGVRTRSNSVPSVRTSYDFNAPGFSRDDSMISKDELITQPAIPIADSDNLSENNTGGAAVPN